MKRLLYITQLLPFPLDAGGKQNTYRSIETLSEEYEVDLVCFVGKKEDLKYKKDLEELCKSVKVFVQPLIDARYGEIKKEILANLLSLKPFLVKQFYSEDFEDYVERLVEDGGVDCLWIDYAYMSQYWKEFEGVVSVLKEHNINYLVKWRNFLKEKKLLHKGFLFLEAVKFYFYEKRVVPKFDRWMVMSEQDKKRLVRLGAREEETVVNALYVPVNKRYEYKKEKNMVLFAGLLSWWPNKEGVTWLVKETFPLIRKEVDEGVELVIVGEQPENMDKEVLEAEGVRFTGYVDEVDSFYERAAVFVAPIRVGGGVRIKVLNAMAAGVPVVSTKMGMEGIPAEQGEEVLVADRPEEFARHVVEALRNKSLAESLSEKGFEFVKKNYGKERVRSANERLLS